MFTFIGILVGFFFGGSIGGAFLGGIIGMLLSHFFNFCFSKVEVKTQTFHKVDFEETMLILIAAVMKADGRIERAEASFVRNYFVRTFGNMKANFLMNRLQEILRENYNIDAICADLRQNSSLHARLLMIQLLFGVATADNDLDSREAALIERIAAGCGISRHDFESIRAMYNAYYQQNNSYQSRSSNSGGSNGYRSHSINSDYQILEIAPTASDEEVKKAYRALAKKYHPDRVAHLGEDMQKAAEEKFAKLSQAYENIRKERGMK